MSCPGSLSNAKNSNVLGGPFNGFSARQTVLNYKDNKQAITRKVLRDGWNTAFAQNQYKGYGRKIGPFRLYTMQVIGWLVKIMLAVDLHLCPATLPVGPKVLFSSVVKRTIATIPVFPLPLVT